jgi:hypothetical protein
MRDGYVFEFGPQMSLRWPCDLGATALPAPIPNRIKGSPWIMTVLATRAERPVNAGDNSRSSFFAE